MKQWGKLLVAIVIFLKAYPISADTDSKAVSHLGSSVFFPTLTQVLDTNLHKYQFVHRNEATVYKGKRQNHNNQHGNYIQGKEAKQ